MLNTRLLIEYKLRECKDISHIFKTVMTWTQVLNFKFWWMGAKLWLQHEQIRIWKLILDSYVGKTESLWIISDKYMLFASREVRIGKNCTLCLRPRAALKTSGTVFPYTTQPRLVNNIFIFFLKLHKILSERIRMIQDCNYDKKFHKLNNFWASKW